jgi:exodeoxyribonuclease VII large subunit
VAEHNSPDRPRILTVSALTRKIKSALETSFPTPVWVEGEISNFTRAHSGHLYFNLKDNDAQISGVMWRFAAERIPFEIENGQQVMCRGQINVYEPRGQYQLQVEIMEPKGKGALQLAFEQLKEKLQKEGLFSTEIKKNLPLLPKKVGVVTSPRGAAIIDILKTLERRFARLHILIYPAKVQGEGAAAEIAAGVDYFGSREDIDTIIVGRGGGSIEDLWAFNEEVVARAVFRCPHPVISAVGHEVDFTIADFVADIRASTPTAAAELVTATEEAMTDGIENLHGRMVQQLRFLTQERKNDLLRLVHHRAFQNFKIKILSLSQRVDELEMRALNSLRNERQRLSEIRARTDLLEVRGCSLIKARLRELTAVWEKLGAELHSLSPLSILQKGYALCWNRDKSQLLRCIDNIEPGDDLTVSFYRGEFACQVQSLDREISVADRSGSDQKT